MLVQQRRTSLLDGVWVLCHPGMPRRLITVKQHKSRKSRTNPRHFNGVRVKNLRSLNGAALSELGPALFIVFVIGLLPILDAIALSANYASAFYLNQLQLREAQKIPKSIATSKNGRVLSQIPNQWRATLLGLSAATVVNTGVDYIPVPWQPVGSNQTIDFWFVSVTTTATFSPLLNIPFFTQVPGLGAPITFSISGRRPVESNRFLNE